MCDCVHLHVHTDFSTLDGACRADRLAERVKGLGMRAVAITDHGSISGVPAFAKAAKAAGIKPIIGCEVYLAGDSRLKKMGDSNPTYHMGLVARNQAGYRNLMLLTTDAQRCGFHYKPRTDLDTVAKYREGLIGFSGCMQGMIPQLILIGRINEARAATQRFIDIFGRDQFFIELMNHGIDEQRRLIEPLRLLAKEFSLRTVASNDVHYLMEGHADAHDAMLCIQTAAKVSDTSRMRYDPRQFWLKSQAEMGRMFAEMPEALESTLLVADMCDLKMDFTGRHYPTFAAPSGCTGGADYLQHLCADGLAQRYGIDYYALTGIPRPAHATTPRAGSSGPDGPVIAARLKHELSVIERSGFTDYFLVVSDFVNWAKANGIPVGPGRGSGAGCMVAYTLGITAIDPHRYGLLFERFLNPERVSPPDLDIDFCQRRRGEVIEYVRRKYGAECVSGIITFNTLGARAVIRDLCRVHSVPLADSDKLSKMITETPDAALEPSHSGNAEFRGMVESSPTYQTVFHQALVLEGMNRNGGRHASGVLISSTPLEQIVPMVRYGDAGEMIAGYDGETVAQLGLLKMDFLGLKTLSVIHDAEHHIRLTKGCPHRFDIRDIPLDDEDTFKLLRSGKTLGVFQFESSGMQSLCRQINVSRFEEIAAANALFRPGPMDLIPEYLRGKRDPSTVTYMHPLLETICRETYGIMVYQEQVMQAAQVIAGYSLGQADLLRRCMGKKMPEEMAKQRSVFVAGAAAVNSISPEVANGIFDVLERFAGYGFNKSHSVGYALLAYQTAYLKAHYPAQFMAALISSETGDTEKCAIYCKEARAMGLGVLGPDVNASGAEFTPEGKAVRYGLGGIKTVGDSAALAIVSSRDEHGPFTSLADLVARVDKRQVNRRALEALIKTGAFGCLEAIPGRLLANLDAAIANAESARKLEQSGQSLLFDMAEPEPPVDDGPAEVDFPRSAALAAEKEFFGFYLSGHPLDDVMPLVESLSTHQPAELQTANDRTRFRLCGLVSELIVKVAKKDGRNWASFVLDTPLGGYPLHCYSDNYEKVFDVIRGDRAVVLAGQVLRGEDGVRLSVSDMVDLEAVAPAVTAGVHVRVAGSDAANFVGRASALAQRQPGEVELRVTNSEDESQVSYRVKMPMTTLRALAAHPAVDAETTEVIAKPFNPEVGRWFDPVMRNVFNRQSEAVFG